MPTIKVLIVDDERDFAIALSERLMLRGYEVSTAFAAEDALPAAVSARPEVVLLDMKMPGMDCSRIFNELKGFDDTMEIIIISGRLADENGLEDIKNRAFDYILKPAELAEVESKLGKAWAVRREKTDGKSAEKTDDKSRGTA
jgi:DNA-binding NtrC family response regulator